MATTPPDCDPVISSESQDSVEDEGVSSSEKKARRIVIRVTNQDDHSQYIQRVFDLDVICKESEYLNTIFYDCQDSDLVNLIEEDHDAAMSLLAMISEDDKLHLDSPCLPTRWNMAFAKLSAKLLISKYISKFQDVIEDELKRLAMKTSFPVMLMINLPTDKKFNKSVSSTSSQQCRECERSVVNVLEKLPMEIIKLVNGRCIFNPIQHNIYGACYESDEYIMYETNKSSRTSSLGESSTSNWDIIKKENDEIITAKAPIKGQLSDQSGLWTFSLHYKYDAGGRVVYRAHSPYTCRIRCEPSPTRQDMMLFSEIFEIILRHDCYRQGWIKSKEDLFTFLEENRDLWDTVMFENVLEKDDLISLLMSCR